MSAGPPPARSDSGAPRADLRAEAARTAGGLPQLDQAGVRSPFRPAVVELLHGRMERGIPDIQNDATANPPSVRCIGVLGVRGVLGPPLVPVAVGRENLKLDDCAKRTIADRLQLGDMGQTLVRLQSGVPL